MKLTLAEPRYLKDSIATISDLVSEARFQITKDGLTLVAMDPANVAMVVFKMFSSAFVEYELKKDISVALNLVHLKNVFRRLGSGDLVTLRVNDEQSKLQVVIAGKSTRTFSLPLLDIDEREQRIPNLEFDLKITLPASDFTDAIDDTSIVSDSLSLACDKKMFRISASGDLTDADIEIPSGNGVTIELTGQEQHRSRYSIEYLKKMVTAAKVAETVTIQFGKDYPLRMEFVEKDRVQLSFVLAPRVENT